MSLENVIASLRSLQISEERPNISTNALLGVIAAKYGIVTKDSSWADVSTDDPAAPSVDEPWWNYVLCCLDCLNCLCSVLQSRECSEPQISISQTHLIKERVEFIVALGLYSHLDEGVGLPIASRLYSAEQFIQPRRGFRQDRVRLIVDCLMKLYENAELRSLLLSNFLHDLLIGLLSLSFHPQMRSDRVQMNRYQARLRRVTTCGIPPVRDIIREVFVIQGAIGGEKSKLSQAPPWLRFACSQVLTKQIEKSFDGVLNVVLGFFDFAGHEGREGEKCSVIAEVIARPPKSLSGEDLEKHWKCIVGQVLKILDSEGDALLVRFAVTFIDSFTKRYPEKSVEIVLDPVLGSSIKCLTSIESLDKCEVEVLSASRLRNVFERLEKFVSNSFDFCETLVVYLSRFLEFAFFTAIQQTPIGTKALDITYGLLKCFQPDHACELLTSIIFNEKSESIGTSLCFHMSKDDELSVRKWKSLCSDDSRWGVGEEQIVDAADAVLHRLPSVYQGRFFISLLQQLRHLVLQESTPQTVRLPCAESSKKNRPDLLLSLIAIVTDKYPECCLSHPEQIVELAKETLCRFRCVQEESTDELTAEFAQESVSISLSLISSVLVSTTTLLPGVEKSPSVVAALDSCVPIVADISNSHPHSGLRQLASDLHTALLTHGHVCLEKTRPLVQEVSADSEIGQALVDASSGLVPIRGHSLIVLSRAVEDRHPEVDVGARQQMLRIFLEAASHPDSYIYLSAVRGLTALAGSEPQEVLPLLLERLGRADDGEGDVGEAKAEFRLKLGEAVMRCVRELGEMVQNYRDRLLNVFLTRCRLEKRPMLRAAAVSNLAEVCRVLRFGLHSCLHEVLAASGSLLEWDDSAEVRAAAAFLLLSLFRGVDQQLWVVLGGEALRDTNRLLRRREKVEREEKVHKMILLACNELEDIVRACLMPGDVKRPVKEIRIL